MATKGQELFISKMCCVMAQKYYINEVTNTKDSINTPDVEISSFQHLN